MTFYEAIQGHNQDIETMLVTAIDGEYAGEKALFCSGERVWASDADGGVASFAETRKGSGLTAFAEAHKGSEFTAFADSHKEELLSITESGLVEISGCTVYAELLGHDKKLVICGAGHVSMAVIAIGKLLGMHVTVIDDRQELVQNAIAKGADQAICMGFEEALREIRGDNDTYYVIVTRGHRYDMDCLRILAQERHAYIGMIGSRKKVRLVMETLEREGIPKEFLDTVYAPIGLSIGAETPEEIAVAVMAQIIEVKNRKKRTIGFPREFMKALLAEGRSRLVLATIIDRRGSAPRGVGSKMLIAGDGSMIGTIGGGLVESRAIARGQQMLLQEQRGPVVMDVDMSAGSAEEAGMVCGGSVKILLEIV